MQLLKLLNSFASAVNTLMSLFRDNQLRNEGRRALTVEILERDRADAQEAMEIDSAVGAMDIDSLRERMRQWERTD